MRYLVLFTLSLFSLAVAFAADAPACGKRKARGGAAYGGHSAYGAGYGCTGGGFGGVSHGGCTGSGVGYGYAPGVGGYASGYYPSAPGAYSSGYSPEYLQYGGQTVPNVYGGQPGSYIVPSGYNTLPGATFPTAPMLMPGGQPGVTGSGTVVPGAIVPGATVTPGGVNVTPGTIPPLRK